MNVRALSDQILDYNAAGLLKDTKVSLPPDWVSKYWTCAFASNELVTQNSFELAGAAVERGYAIKR